MRAIGRSSRFKKIYQKRIAPDSKLVTRFDKRVSLFAKGISGYPVNDHALTGKLAGKRAFSISGDVRVVYEIIDGVCVFLDVGTHSQVYGK